MTFTVKQGRYRQRSDRVGKQVRAVHMGRVGGAQSLRRPTQMDGVPPEIKEKILALYRFGYGDKRIAKIIHEEDQIGDEKPIGYNVIRTYRHSEGVMDRVKETKPEPENWRAIADEQSIIIDGLNRSLVHERREREILSGELRACREQNYNLMYHSSVVEST